MCAQLKLFPLFLPGQPTQAGLGERNKFVKGLIPARTQKRSIILARGTKYQQGDMGAGNRGMKHRVEEITYE